MGAKTDLSFEDALDKRLEYIDGSLYLKVDGKPSDEFEAEFDKNANKIVVQDKSTSSGLTALPFNCMSCHSVPTSGRRVFFW